MHSSHGLAAYPVDSITVNVAARLVLWASLMRFFLIQAETKKMTGSNNAFFFGVGFLGWVSSCLLMVNLKAATT